jgi:two-component system, NtrC family, nitrogen regulation response regulator GlnG
MDQKRMRMAYRMAVKSDAHVLITGETGTGKSSLAFQIHQQSSRKDRPFITVNLATLHEGTMESELFGHERGAFTGADQKRMGKLELAHGGTVFLDEMGELPLRLQARLLEFLQSKKIYPIGGNREVQLDVRVIAATHQDLDQSVKNKNFREDLYHRLCVIALHLNSIRDQEDEFDSILQNCLHRVCEKLNTPLYGLSQDVVEELRGYAWPGNYRELSHVLEYGVLALEEGQEIGLNELPWSFFVKKEGYIHQKRGVEGGRDLGLMEIPLSLDYRNALCTFEKEYFRRMLYRNSGKITRTAKQIGLPKSTLLRRIRAYELTLAN